MTTRLHRFDECEKFRKYKCGSMLGPDSPPFDPEKPKILISKAIEIEFAEKALNKAAQSGITDLSQYDDQIEKLKMELDEMFAREGKNSSKGCANSSCKSENFGLKAFTRDLRTNFKGLDDIYVCHALCGAWGGVRPATTHLDSKIVSCKLFPGLCGTMDDLTVVKIVEGSIGLVHLNQAKDLYESIYSYLSTIGITGVKVDEIHTLEYVSEDYGGRVELAKAYYKGLSKSLAKNFNGIGLISSMQQCNDFFLLGTQQISMGRFDPNGDPMGDIGYKGGVVGAFNCQGAGWDPKEQRIKGYSYYYRPISSSVRVSDIEWDQKEEATEMGEAEEYAIYCSEADELIVTTCDSEAIPITIQPSTFEIFSFIPIKKLGRSLKFAPIGLINMFNSEGTIQGLVYNETGVEIELKGGGNFLAYSSVSTKKCYLSGSEVGFNWSEDGKLGLYLPWIEEASGISIVTFVFSM
ncbi:stachyose synthase [Olea europaea subsp. europaea]|uniref:Stachyose synthase n=1 Tax=Olea europaea subsp. europaea TaxID=158383 RepID=A0A8S0QG59_OLEEU|nr:stachyose synthase [Olea europaea subsp. europaea]